MRRSALLQQDVCIFCACRLTSQPLTRPLFSSPRRQQSTTAHRANGGNSMRLSFGQRDGSKSETSTSTPQRPNAQRAQQFKRPPVQRVKAMPSFGAKTTNEPEPEPAGPSGWDVSSSLFEVSKPPPAKSPLVEDSTSEDRAKPSQSNSRHDAAARQDGGFTITRHGAGAARDQQVLKTSEVTQRQRREGKSTDLAGQPKRGARRQDTAKGNSQTRNGLENIRGAQPARSGLSQQGLKARVQAMPSFLSTPAIETIDDAESTTPGFGIDLAAPFETTSKPVTPEQSVPEEDRIADSPMHHREPRTTPQTAYSPTVRPTDTERGPDNWQHLRPKHLFGNENTPANVGRREPMPRNNSVRRPPQGGNDIDRLFEEYRRKRDAKPHISNPYSDHRTFNSIMANVQSTVSSRSARSEGERSVLRPDFLHNPNREEEAQAARIETLAAEERDRAYVEEQRKTAPQEQSSKIPLRTVTAYTPQFTASAEVSRPERHRDAEVQDTPRYDREEPEAPTKSSFDERIQRTLQSSRFGDAPARRERLSRTRRSRDDDEDEYVSARDLVEVDADLAAAQEQRRASRQAKQEQLRLEREAAARRRDHATVSLPDYTTAANLAQMLGVHYDQFLLTLERLRFDDIFPGKVLNAETSGSIALEFGFDPIFASDEVKDSDRDLKPQPEPEAEEKEYWPNRPPVVTIMGHVDHGKTTILDYLRKASVAAGEAGGITQHIGAFSVEMQETGRTITFLDTPGHAAFLAMRQRGATVTDIVVLVVAADDSVKPQTLEALKHARGAGVPIIVAVNKVDKPEANVQQVKNDLGKHGVEIEEYGGETQVVEISGKTGQGMGDLEEAIVSQSEILDHRADLHGIVEGWVLEAATKPQGRVATVLVKRGTLKVGTILVAGRTWTRVRTLHDDTGREVEEATPGMPVEVTGWRDQPLAGDQVLEADTEQQATSVVEYRSVLEERKKLAADTEAINAARSQTRLEQEQEEGEAPRKEQSVGPTSVPIIIKADVSGSAEALEAYILSISSQFIVPQVLYSEVGQVHESDVERAAVDNGIIISFNQSTEENIKGQISAAGVQLLEHNIIYKALDDVKDTLQDRLPQIVIQKVTGEAEVAADFEIGIGGRKKLKIAGSKVRNGVIAKTSRVRVMRGTEKVYDGAIGSLKNVKKDATEMRKGSECGIAFENWEDFQVGDIVQTYAETTEKRTL